MCKVFVQQSFFNMSLMWNGTLRLGTKTTCLRLEKDRWYWFDRTFGVVCATQQSNNPNLHHVRLMTLRQGIKPTCTHRAERIEDGINVDWKHIPLVMTSWQTKPPTKKSYILWGWQYRRNKFICLIYVGQAEYALLIRGPNVFNANKNTMSIIKTIILLRIRTRAEKCTAQFQGSRNWNYFLESAWLEIIQVKALTNIIGYHFDLSVIKSELVQTLWGLFLSEGKMECEIERWTGVAGQ